MSRLDVVERLLAGERRARGRVLDAGTGGGYMTAQLARLEPSVLVSVSLDESSFAAARARLSAGAMSRGKVVFRRGDLADPGFAWELAGLAGPFDLVVGDYLLAAVAGHRPFAEPEVIDALIRLTGPGGRLVLTGLEPGVPCETAEHEVVRLILRWRDAAAYLAGDEMYREFPCRWVLRELEEALERSVRARPPGERRDSSPPGRISLVTWSEALGWSLAHLAELADDAVRRAEGCGDNALARFLRRRLDATLKQAARLTGFAGGRASVAWSCDWVIVVDF